MTERIEDLLPELRVIRAALCEATVPPRLVNHNDVVEKCARMVDRFTDPEHRGRPVEDIAAAIRGLAD